MKPNHVKTMENAAKRMRVSKFLGFNCVTIVNGKSVTKPLDILLFLTNIFFGLLLLLFLSRQKQTLTVSSSEIANTGNYVMFIALIVVAIVSMIANFMARHRNWGIVLTLVEIEKIV